MSAIGSERRQHPRAKSPDVSATLTSASGECSTCGVEDISAGGAKLSAEVAPIQGERVKVHFTSPGKEPLPVSGTVLRVEALSEGPLHFVAVRFDKLADPIQDTIRGIVLRALERERRATSR